MGQGVKAADEGRLADHADMKAKCESGRAAPILPEHPGAGRPGRLKGTRELLSGTEFDACISRIFAEDIALYDSLATPTL